MLAPGRKQRGTAYRRKDKTGDGGYQNTAPPQRLFGHALDRIGNDEKRKSAVPETYIHAVVCGPAPSSPVRREYAGEGQCVHGRDRCLNR